MCPTHEKEKKMPTYTQYQKSNGANLWRVTGYLGVNPETKKQVNINKGGFLTQKAAKAYYRQVSYDIFKKWVSKSQRCNI